jgi:hypothetical protein
MASEEAKPTHPVIASHQVSKWLTVLSGGINHEDHDESIKVNTSINELRLKGVGENDDKKKFASAEFTVATQTFAIHKQLTLLHARLMKPKKDESSVKKASEDLHKKISESKLASKHKKLATLDALKNSDKVMKLITTLEKENNVELFLKRNQLNQRKTLFSKSAVEAVSKLLDKMVCDALDVALVNAHAVSKRKLSVEHLLFNGDHLNNDVLRLMSQTKHYRTLVERENRRAASGLSLTNPVFLASEVDGGFAYKSKSKKDKEDVLWNFIDNFPENDDANKYNFIPYVKRLVKFKYENVNASNKLYLFLSYVMTEVLQALSHVFTLVRGKMQKKIRNVNDNVANMVIEVLLLRLFV